MPGALAPATPRLKVQFGSFLIDETTGCILCSEYDADDTSAFGNFYIEFRVRLTAPTGDAPTDDASFATLVNAVETNLRIPRQRLLVKIGTSVVRDWNFTSNAQTAILIEPELKLIEENCRDYHYGFRVRCQFPGNVPSNVFRRESLTTIGDSLRERRTCSITATWTSSPSETAYQRYLDSGDAFYTAYLPANVVDQHGTTGAWVRADENPAHNDENSLVTATRVYWEIFGGRRESTQLTITKIDGRRICTIPGTWVASGGHTALQNYIDNGGAFFSAVLPANVTSGEWVLVDEEPAYNDPNGVLTVVRTYHEVVGGLREYAARVTADASGIRQLVLTGVYYATSGSTAKANYAAGIAGLVSSALGAEGITQYESVSVPRVTGYDTTGLRYFFTWTITELAYPQGPAADDANVLLEFLEVRVLKPFDPQSTTGSNAVTRLKTVVAKFVANIDVHSSGGGDPVALWTTRLRAHVVTAVTTKLGSYVSAAQVVEEEVGAGLSANQLIGTLRLVVTGGSILWLRITQSLTQVPGRDFAARADGTNFSLYPYRAPPEKLLHREAECEFVLDAVGMPPTLFGVADNTVSGYGLIDTGVTAQQSVDDQNASGTLSLPTNGWFIDRRQSPPFNVTVLPSERGDGSPDFRTVAVKQIENWRFVAALEPGTSI